MANLFTATDLTEWLGLDLPVPLARAVALEQVVWGWLKPKLGLAERPTPVPAEVFSWAIELGAIAYENPTGLDARQLGDENKQFSLERRAQILEEATDGGVGALAPRGSFPAAQCYPDAAMSYPHGRYF